MATSGVKRKRCSYDASFKLRVVQAAESSSNAVASREYCVNEKQVREWRKSKTTLLEIPRSKRACRGKQAAYVELERTLIGWISEQRKDGYIVTAILIRLRALALAKDEKYNVPRDFKASHGWCGRFMQRHHLSIRQRTKISQKLPADLEVKITNFHSFLCKLRRQTDFPIAQIGNMDESPLCFDMPGAKTVNLKSNKTVYVRSTGHERTHFTVVLSCLANGTKLRPMVIFKRKTLPKEKFPSGVLVHCHPKGWMDEEGVLLWLAKVWGTRPGGLLRTPSILVWDQFRGHLTDKVKQKLKDSRTNQAVILGGLTSVLQPLDVVLNKPFKDRVRRQWQGWMSAGLAEKTPSGNLKKPGLSLVTSWVKSAWDDIPEEMVIQSFLKCGISNATDGTEDHYLWEETEDDSSEVTADCADDITDGSGWDADQHLTQGEWDKLFGESDEGEADFEGFK